MSRIFLDANIILDYLRQSSTLEYEFNQDDVLVASPLSFHIASYVFKREIPDMELLDLSSDLELIPFDQKILSLAYKGPTLDLEDNIQLHSAAQSGCDIFVTRDKGLLKLAYFGTMEIVSGI